MIFGPSNLSVFFIDTCTRGSLLIFSIHVHSGPIYWGVHLPCRKDYKVIFYM